ncbi:MAG: RluA family pseudouridine synthase [Bdellovibrio sp.]|nr:RluA family pseudouridine synthase [Bdellovibrio sp.]
MLIVSKSFKQDSYTVILEVTETSKELRLDQFLQIYLQSLSREFIKNKIKSKEVMIHGRPGNLRPATRVLKGERVQLFVQRSHEEDEYWNGKQLPLEKDPLIIFEDQNIIVISKPPYMTTHPTGRHLFYCATVYFENIHQRMIHSIHRIDRETSGILLLGKNPVAANQLSTEFENNRVKKVYFFIAKKHPTSSDPVTFHANERMGPMEDGPKRVFIHAFPENSQEGKEAKTYFEIFWQNPQYALGLAFPVTGRQHQIRVHASAHGFPLLGDKLYLGNYPMFQRFKDHIATPEEHDFMELPRQALHATALKITYQNRPQLFLSPLPYDLRDWIQHTLKLETESVEKEIKQRVENYFRER